ncbi:hypothetical protein F2P81_003945 [Scophthalmus maximus]|uniref:Reverse transcriptase RNase H-like domain-containing protein n=1 Tax=Scophthalmus maximus TaxID=52904 RepID=A0A6A4TDY7_SCOMX|nr:hypothetical protein F2P81_003945 [Scophthalmus maximus]
MYNHNQRLMRWALLVQGYNLEIKKGADNVVADALCRGIHHCLRSSNCTVIYSSSRIEVCPLTQGESQLKLGNYLGDLTDELKVDSIVEFAAAGPKSYAYKTKNNRVLICVKGITQTHKCSECIHFDSVKELVEGFVQNSATDAVL